MRQTLLLTLMTIIIGNTSASYASDDLTTYGDYMQRIIPAAGLGLAIYKGDKEGQKQWVRNTLATVAGVAATKEAFKNTTLGDRPGNNGDRSFISGHTAYACSGAAFIGKRYGAEYGGVAFGLASLVGYSRVHADKHHWRDVIGGCAMSYGISQLFVTEQGMENIVPVVGPDIIGLRLDFSF